MSAAAAAVPLVVLGYALAVRRTAAWKASLAGLLAALAVACGVYGMPPTLAAAAGGYGVLVGLFALGWMVGIERGGRPNQPNRGSGDSRARLSRAAVDATALKERDSR